MGLLDRMIGDLIARETGLPVSRLVRRAGVGRLAALGGLAVGAAAAADWAQRRQTSTGAPPASLPPLPTPSTPLPLPPLPTPPAAVSPPAPPAPPAAAPAATLAETDDDGLSPALRFAVLRTIAAAALADGQLGAAERATLERHVEGAALAPDQLARLRSDLTLPATPGELAALTTSLAEAEVLYRFAVLVIAADGEARPAEQQWLATLATALGLSAELASSCQGELLAGISAGESPSADAG